MSEQSQEQIKHLPRTMSRRQFLAKGAAASAGASLIALFGKKGYDMLTTTAVDGETPPNEFMRLGEVEEVNLSQYGIQWTPDGHIPYATFADQEKIAFVSGNASSFAMETTNDNLLKPRDTDGSGAAISCYGPDLNKEYRNGYGAITSILPLDQHNQDHVFALAHNEQWTAPDNAANAVFSIGLLESHDKGKTWEDHGPLLQAADALPVGQEKTTGVGQPCAIIKEDQGKPYVYIYYLYIPANNQAPLIHLSRAPIVNGQLGSVEHYTENGFQGDVPINPKTIKPIIKPANIEATNSQTALPSVRYNTQKSRYEMVFEGQHGFYATTSQDGITWNAPQQIFKFHQGQYPHKDGDIWFSNPTLWSDKTSDQQGNNPGYLIYSKGEWPQPHHMVRRPFTLK